MPKKKGWLVCKGGYGVVVRRGDQPHPGGKIWKCARKMEAINAAKAIRAGTYGRLPDKQLCDLS